MGEISDAARKLAGKVEVDFADWHELRKDQVRCRVIVGDALLEKALDHLIRCKLPPRDEVLGQLLAAINLNDKTRLAYVLGLITKGTMQDVKRLHNIRNIFAHECKPDSYDPDLVKQVLALSTVKGRKNQVTRLNLMDFYFEAGRKCRDSILRAIDESKAMTQTNDKKNQTAGSRPE